ncbi:Poly [ADP-ribose] polymerase 6 [Grifola frondosa]|uniref:Poly [ADP-ribose] polymerase 6 n=1 Tax=Grifola frondosa TaxID=5627 RepID=A0A1C7M7G6_GRIFR|nr:Poly [ADP-ribose] polymerase 6 [Grifola frondosa]
MSRLRSGIVFLATEDSQEAQRASKRQKTSQPQGIPAAASSAPSPAPIVPTMNNQVKDVSTPSGSKAAVAPLKGRRRFLADLNEMKQCCEQVFEVQGLQLRRLDNGDDEGSFVCTIYHASGERLVSLNLMASDTSEYPNDHTFFCFSQDDNVPPSISPIIESIHEEGSRTIKELFTRLLSQLAKRTALSRRLQNHQSQDAGDVDADIDENVDEESDIDDEYLDDDFGIVALETSDIDKSVLQRDFNEVVACNYRPGFIRFGIDEFALSVSLPVISLAECIPPRALMAWDRRLLSRTQHLTLLIAGLRGTYPLLHGDGAYRPEAVARGVSPLFRVGLTSGYKPQKEHAADVVRRFGLKEEFESETHLTEMPQYVSEDLDDIELSFGVQSEPELEDEEGFHSFSLSSSLEALLDNYFLSVQIKAADEEEAELASSYVLPPDPLLVREPPDHLNFPLLAFCYLIRRLTLCPRYCLVCHGKLQSSLEVLKPYVCDSKLCTYQYYNLNRGPSLEYEIRTNPAAIDLLVSLAYIAAAESSLDAPLPVGMGLRVHCKIGPPPNPAESPDGLHDFDKLDLAQMRAVIVDLIDCIPPIMDIKKYLDKPTKAGITKPRLRNMDASVPEASWLILRWVVASCTSHIEELHSEEDRVQNIGEFHLATIPFQCRGADAEAKFMTAINQAKTQDPNACQYPSLYAFHGSHAKNWHSIIRHGLWWKKDQIANGRAHGHGVYFAKDGNYSMSTYAAPARTSWRKSCARIVSCVALAEIVNLPSRFVSQSPFLVVADTEWIVCRYLLVKSADGPAPGSDGDGNIADGIPFVSFDPKHPTTLANKPIQIPEPSYKLEKVLAARRHEYFEIDYDDDDAGIFTNGDVGEQSSSQPASAQEGPADDWTHDPEPLLRLRWALQRELKAMLKEQSSAKCLRDLGWYMPPELIGDNLFQWIVELHSFENELPIANDMSTRGVNSLVFEIRFPPTFPHEPPFFRILKPRFLPFIQGGGGHVTGGGSMCMDLLTTDASLRSFSRSDSLSLIWSLVQQGFLRIGIVLIVCRRHFKVSRERQTHITGRFLKDWIDLRGFKNSGIMKRGFTHVHKGLAAAFAHGKRDACSSGGFYKNPTAGQSIDASSPVNISWDVSCMNTTAVDIYLYAPSASQPRIHEWQTVDFSTGSYSATLQTGWWNSSASVNLQLAIVASGTPPFLATMPAGPVFTATYSGTATNKQQQSKGKVAAAVIIPLLVIAALVAWAYIKYSRAKGRKQRKRFSQAIDKRMSTISTDWKSMFLPVRKPRYARAWHTVAVEGGQAGIGARGMFDLTGTEGPQMSQLRPGARTSNVGERVSRISFAADPRPSAESRRTRAFHTVMRTGGEEKAGKDKLLFEAQAQLPTPPSPTHQPKSSIVGIMPMQPMPANMMSPDEMLRAYAERRALGSPTIASPALPAPTANYNGNGMRTLYSPTTGPVSPESMYPTTPINRKSMAPTEYSRYDDEDAYVGTAE